MSEFCGISFTIPGEPSGKGRPRFTARGPHVRAVTPQKTLNYEALVKMAYEEQCGGEMFDKGEPLCMWITAYQSIPRSESKKRQGKMMSGAIRPTKKPDWDNIGKIVCDALNKIAFYDDAQIVDARVVKRYATKPRVEVRMWRCSETEG